MRPTHRERLDELKDVREQLRRAEDLSLRATSIVIDTALTPDLRNEINNHLEGKREAFITAAKKYLNTLEVNDE